jgi:hypothetical protein
MVSTDQVIFKTVTYCYLHTKWNFGSAYWAGLSLGRLIAVSLQKTKHTNLVLFFDMSPRLASNLRSSHHNWNCLLVAPQPARNLISNNRRVVIQATLLSSTILGGKHHWARPTWFCFTSDKAGVKQSSFSSVLAKLTPYFSTLPSK